MKQTKNIVIRITAMVLFLALISAIILYDGGAYDFSFIKRPVLYTTTDDTGTSPEDTTPDTTTDNTTSGGDTTTAPPPVSSGGDEDILNEIKTLDELLKNGYSVSYDKFGSSSALALTDAPYLDGEFSLADHTVTKREFYQKADGTFWTKYVDSTVALPRVRLYFGYAIVNNGKKNVVYNQSGKKISKEIGISLEYQKTFDGAPVVKSNGKYFKLTKDGLVSITEDEINRLPIALDSPRYFAKSNIDLHPFKTRKMFLIYIEDITTTAPETTEPETTDPNETTDPDVTADTDITTDTTGSDTSSDDVTTTPDTTDQPSEPSVRTVTDTTDTTDTTGTDTSDSTDVTTEPEQTTEPEPPPEPEDGDIIEKDGKRYRVEYREVYGYKNSAGEVKIEPSFYMAYDFTSDGLACVMYDQFKLMFINTKGERAVALIDNPYITPAELNYKKHYQTYYPGINNDINDYGMYYFQNGYAMIRYSILDAKTASKLVKNENRLVDKKGNSLPIPGEYSLEGYSDSVMLLSKDGRYGYLNVDHSWVSEPLFDDARPFFQGLAVAHTESGYGMIATDGSVVLPFTFDYISDVSDGRIAAYSEELGWKLYTIVKK